MDARFHLVLLCVFLSACGGKKAKSTSASEQEPVPSDSQRIENLSQTVSRMQSRLEELDAKLSTLTDRIAPAKPAVETSSLPTEVIGVAAKAKSAKSTPVQTMEMDEATATFLKANQLFKSGKFTDAVLEFNKFTENFPDHILAGSAQYYVGESYFSMGEYKLALPEFEKTVSRFPNSPRVVNAQVRSAQCLKNLGKEKESETLMVATQNLYAGNPSIEVAANVSTKKSAHEPLHLPTVTVPTTTSPTTEVIDTLPLEPMGLEQPAKTHE